MLSTRTFDESFSYLNNIQGQFIDRTKEWDLQKDKEKLINQKENDQKIIEEKSLRLESLATRLAKYLSPQIYQSIFSDTEGTNLSHKRKNLTVFFSDIVQFTDLTDTLEPERLAVIINSYLSEMATIALECGGTIDKFIGDAVFVFFGDPESEGELDDALNCVEMALRMKERIGELQKYWKKQGIQRQLEIRMGIATGYCTVGNFGSEQRLDYTALGRPVNLASRLEGLAEPNTTLVDETTFNLIHDHVKCEHFNEVNPKGMSRPVKVYKVIDFVSSAHRKKRQQLSRVGKYIELNVINSSDMQALIKELHEMQKEFEKQIV